MNLQRAVLAAALVFVVSVSLGGTERDVPLEVADETAEMNGSARSRFPLTSFRTDATMLTQILWQIATGCTWKRATIMKQSKQGRSG